MRRDQWNALRLHPRQPAFTHGQELAMSASRRIRRS